MRAETLISACPDTPDNKRRRPADARCSSGGLGALPRRVMSRSRITVEANAIRSRYARLTPAAGWLRGGTRAISGYACRGLVVHGVTTAIALDATHRIAARAVGPRDDALETATRAEPFRAPRRSEGHHVETDALKGLH